MRKKLIEDMHVRAHKTPPSLSPPPASLCGIVNAVVPIYVFNIEYLSTYLSINYPSIYQNRPTAAAPSLYKTIFPLL